MLIFSGSYFVFMQIRWYQNKIMFFQLHTHLESDYDLTMYL